MGAFFYHIKSKGPGLLSTLSKIGWTNHFFFLISTTWALSVMVQCTHASFHHCVRWSIFEFWGNKNEKMPDKVGNSSKVFNYFQILQSSLYLTMPYGRICKEVRYGITFIFINSQNWLSRLVKYIHIHPYI